MPAIRNSLLRQISLITNKLLPLEQTYYATDILWKQSSGLLEAGNLTENSIRVIFWISKGLVLRLAKTEEVLQRLLSLLSNDHHGLVVGRGFGLLLAPDEVLSKENGATIRLLAQQKVFNYCIPKIAADFRHVEISIKPNYLIALSGILKYMPTEIVVAQIETLLPLLLQSLDLKDQDVKAATIESLIFINQESSAAVEGHIPSLINRLLKSAENPNENVAVSQIPNRIMRLYGIDLIQLTFGHTEGPAQRPSMLRDVSGQGQRQRSDTVSIHGHSDPMGGSRRSQTRRQESGRGVPSGVAESGRTGRGGMTLQKCAMFLSMEIKSHIFKRLVA